MKIGVLGGDQISQAHLAVLHGMKDVEITGFFAPNENNASLIQSTYNITQYQDIEALISKVDVVDIASSTVPHFECAVQAIRQSKHLFIENPVTSTFEETKRLMNLTHEADVKVQIGNIERFNVAYRAITPLVTRPISIESRRMLKYDVDKTFQSVVLDLMIHDIDLILSLVKSPIKRVSANGLALTNGSPDYVNARLEFDNGCVATLIASRISFKDAIDFTVYQNDTTYFVDLLHKKCESLSIKGIKNLKIKSDKVKKGEIYFNYPEIKESNIIKEELSSFLAAIKNNTTPLVTIEESYMAFDVANQILEKLNIAPNLMQE